MELISKELHRLDEQLRKSFEGEAWHGPSLMEALKGVNAEQAAAHPVPGAHSIWELVTHLAGTYGLVLKRLEGKGWELPPDEDWPSTPAVTEENWKAAMENLKSLNFEIRSWVKRYQPEKLDEQIVNEVPYTAYTQFIGITQHDLYHAGQIVILRKLLGI